MSQVVIHMKGSVFNMYCAASQVPIYANVNVKAGTQANYQFKIEGNTRDQGDADLESSARFSSILLYE